MHDYPSENNSDTTKLAMDWKANLPKEVQGWQEVQQSDSPEKFFDQMANMRKRMGQSIRVPGQDAGEEQLNEFYQNLQKRVPGLMRTPNPEDPESMEQVMRALGKPEDEQGYTLEDATEDELKDLRAMAKEVGMTKAQFKKFAQGMLGANKMSQQQLQQQIEREQITLKSDWGAATDERYENILNVAEATGASEQIINAIKTKTIDAKTAKWLYQLGKQLGGEAVQNHVQQKTMDPDEARENIEDILNNQQHPYWHASHPDHKKAVDKVINLHRLANGAA